MLVSYLLKTVAFTVHVKQGLVREQVQFLPDEIFDQDMESVIVGTNGFLVHLLHHSHHTFHFSCSAIRAEHRVQHNQVAFFVSGLGVPRKLFCLLEALASA